MADYITYYPDLVQGSDEWLAARCGILTASNMRLIVTPGRRTADNDKVRAHLYELLAQRITKYVEPVYITDDMLRGQDEEILARDLYAEKVAPVQQMGFIVNRKWGFPIGYSPDGLVGDDGLIEIKSRRMKYQIETLIQHFRDGSVPSEYLVQIQTGLLVSEREWCDFISYCGGLPMLVARVFVDDVAQEAILQAAHAAEERLSSMRYLYENPVACRVFPTERQSMEIVL